MVNAQDGMDYIDVFPLHYFDVPPPPVKETMSALNDIECSGKARCIAHSVQRVARARGVSNAQIAQAWTVST